MHDEHVLGVDCFGARCTIALTASAAAPLRAVTAARFLLECHERLSRFLPDSELSRLNADRRETVPVSPLMLDFLLAAVRAAEASGGLVDPTVLPALRRAGYATSLPARDPGDLAAELPASGAGRRAAAPDPAARWRSIRVDPVAATVTRPVGLEIDSGGVAKGWAADAAAAMLAGAPTCAVECAGDLRVGGSAGSERRIEVADPFGGDPVGVLSVRHGGVATSGTGRRRWRNPDGSIGHHLIDPSTGRPCQTGVVQATALASTAV
jgi:thiamine biosynthesis lipoprotein